MIQRLFTNLFVYFVATNLPPPSPLPRPLMLFAVWCNRSLAQGVRKNVRMHGPLWDKVSSEAKELIQNLMAFDPGARLTVDKV